MEETCSSPARFPDDITGWIPDPVETCLAPSMILRAVILEGEKKITDLQTCSVGTDHGYGYGYGYEAMGMGTGTGSRPWVWVQVRVRDHGYGYGYGYDM